MAKIWIIAAVAGCSVLKTFAAESDNLVLVGTFEEKTGSRHAFAFNPSLLDLVRKAKSPIVNRGFVAKTSKKKCCKPIKLSEHVWKCCDGTYLITNNSMYSALLESKIEDEKWTDEVWEKELAKIPSWQSIIGALGKSPPVEIKQSEPLFDSLPWKEIPSYRESPVPH